MLACPSCQSLNPPDAPKCSVCGISLAFDPQELFVLRLELQILKKEFQGKIQSLEQKINLLESQIAFQKQKEQSQAPSESKTSKPVFNPEPVVKPIQPVKPEEPKVTQVPLHLSKPTEKPDYQPIKEQPVPPPPKPKTKIPKPEPTEPSFLDEVLFIPFAHFQDLAAKTYTYYKEQNKLPVFFMSVGGILALLLGFGYLLQYTSTYFLELFKIAFTLLSVAALIRWGIRLPQKNDKFKEFGSALLGLGISLNYLVIYFLSNSSVFAWANSPFLSFTLIILNTLLAGILALRYETKIVVVLSLCGGAFAPVYLNIPISEFYLSYLWLLTLSTILISQKIDWEWGGVLAFAIVSLVIESIVSQPANFAFSFFTQNVVVLSFGYLFFYYSFFKGTKLKETLKAREILILAANVSLLLANCFSIYETAGLRQSAGYVYLVNALIFIVLFLVFRQKLSRQMQALLWVMAGTFAGFAVPVAFDQQWSGLFWSIEAVALIYCGFLFGFSTVRYEGYVVLLIALGKIFLTLPMIFVFWQTILWTEGYINAVVLVGLSVILVFLFQKNASNCKKWETWIAYGAFEMLSLTSAFAFFVLAHFQFRDWAYPTAVLGLYFFIFWAKKHKLILTEILAWTHFVWLGFGIIASFAQANGMTLLTFQPPFGKATIILTFLSVGFLQIYYQKILPKLIPDFKESENTIVIFWTKLLNSLFFLAIPILFLPSVNFFFPDYLPLAIWGSVLVAFILHELTKRIEILGELHFLVFVATTFIFSTLQNFELARLTILSSLALLVFLFVFRKGYSKTAFPQSPYQFIFTYTFYYVGLCIFLITIRLNEGLGTAALPVLLTVLYFVGLVFWHKKIAALEKNAWLAWRIAQVPLTLLGFFFLSTVSMNPMSGLTFLFILLIFSILYVLLYRLAGNYPHEEPKWRLIDLCWVHILFALFYASMVNSFLPSMGGITTILLILQAIILLFNSAVKIYKPLTYLSIAFFIVSIIKLYTEDLVNFTEVQKVIVLMVIGVLMLLAAYLFVKFREMIEKKSKNLE